MLSKRDSHNPDKKINRLRKVLFELSSSEPVAPSIPTDLPFTEVSDLLTWYAKGQYSFQGMALCQTNLVRVHLPFIDLSESNLSRANLSKANLAGATLNHTDFTSANLSEVNLIGAEMIRAKLTGANLSRALMSSADLSGANLRKADLRGASLAGANLNGVDFSGALLENVNLEGANLRGANFSNTDLSREMIASLDLEEAILSPTQNALLWQLTDHKASYTPQPHLEPEPDLDYLTQPAPAALLRAGESWREVDPDVDPFADPFATPADESLQPSDRPLEESAPAAFEESAPVDPPFEEATLPPLQEDSVPPPLDEPAGAGLWEPSAPMERSLADSVASSFSDDYPTEFTPPPPAQPEPAAFATVSSSRPHTPETSWSVYLEAYNYQCAITGCEIRALLEVVSIGNGESVEEDEISSHLVLRTDLRSLLELHLIAIHPDHFTVQIAPDLWESDYASLAGKPIHVPTDPAQHPNRRLLAQHLKACVWYSGVSQAAKSNSLPLQDGAVQNGSTTIESEELEPTVLEETDGVLESASSPRLVSQVGKRFPAIKVAVACLLLGGAFWAGTAFQQGLQQAKSSSEKVSSSRAATAPSPGKAATITLAIGPVQYPGRGVILNNSAYAPLPTLAQVGPSTGEIPASQQVEYQGEKYFKIAYLKELGIQVSWDGKTRTMQLTPSKKLEIQEINLAVNSQNYPNEGLIVGTTSLVPINRLQELKVDPTKIAERDRVQYQDQPYLPASMLKQYAVQVAWDKETRTLALSH